MPQTNLQLAETPTHWFWHSQSCLEIQFETELKPELFLALDQLAEQIRQSELAQGALSSYASIAVYFEQPQSSPSQVMAQIKAVISQHSAETNNQSPRKLFTFPAVYNGDDLVSAAESIDLSPQQLINRHCQQEYMVAAIGFLPHFAYLWGLDPTLALPRLSTPRARVPAGAIGIAGEQTGVYPQVSPGGWRLIGQLANDAALKQWKTLKVGDRVRFQNVEEL